MDTFVVLKDTHNPKHTVYPQVHYVYCDDQFNPALDVADQEKDDVSILVDLDADGNVAACNSLSPNCQVLDCRLEQQQLPDLQSQLLKISYTQAQRPTDIPDLDDAKIDSLKRVLADLKRRNDELRALCDVN